MNKKSEALGAIAGLLSGRDDVVVVTHVLPDGDGVGALLALGLGLKGTGRKVAMALDSSTRIPVNYRFLPGADEVVSADQVSLEKGRYLFVSVDCAGRVRAGTAASLADGARKTINIDHHPGNDNAGDLNLVDEKAAASCMLVLDLLDEMGLELTEEIAVCLYTGIVTDTGRFQYTNTSEETFEVARRLVSLGVSPNRVFQEVYENSSFENLKLLGKMVGRARFFEQIGLVYALITSADFAEAGVSVQETEYFVDYLRQVGGSRVVALAKQMDEGTYRVSLRSKRDVDVGEVARRFGGGGHRQAAAFTSTDDPKVALKKLCRELERQADVVKG